MGFNRRTDIIHRQKDIESWIQKHESKSYICRQLNCRPMTLTRYLKQMGILYGGNKGAKGKKMSPNRKTALEYINSNGVISSYKLKNKLLEDGIRDKSCEKCGYSQWNNKPIPLELHHIDGNRFNNKLYNLKIFCPNCHSQEENNSGAANKKH